MLTLTHIYTDTHADSHTFTLTRMLTLALIYSDA